mmetsp:Transcript_21307/g.25649  ORF Transcript_21307/g.25649 Transcript_21307/m.25649 type:complete len:203 (+) Transcript_21307:483-1091(+)
MNIAILIPMEKMLRIVTFVKRTKKKQSIVLTRIHMHMEKMLRIVKSAMKITVIPTLTIVARRQQQLRLALVLIALFILVDDHLNQNDLNKFFVNFLLMLLRLFITLKRQNKHKTKHLHQLLSYLSVQRDSCGLRHRMMLLFIGHTPVSFLMHLFLVVGGLPCHANTGQPIKSRPLRLTSMVNLVIADKRLFLLEWMLLVIKN